MTALGCEAYDKKLAVTLHAKLLFVKICSNQFQVNKICEHRFRECFKYKSM